MLCYLLTGISQAAVYIWTGATGNGIYENQGNWTVDGSPNGYYPQSDKDSAIIGADAGTITWSAKDHNFFGDTNTIQIGPNSTLVCAPTKGDFAVNTVTLEGNSHLIFESTNAFGLSNNFTLDFGTFTAAEHGTWTATDILGFWANNKTVSLTGTLDMNSLSGSGTIELAAVKSTYSGNTHLTLDLSGLNITNTSTTQATVSQVTENGVTRVIVSYESVPEPAACTLSLLGLGALLLRRRRS